MDFPPELLLFIIWGVIALVGRIAKRPQGGQPKSGPRQRPAQQAPRERARGKPETFDDLLTEMREQLEAAKRAEMAEREAAERPGLPRPVPVERPHQPLPSAEEVEDRETLEEEPVIVSLEVPAPIEEREIVDHDAESEIAIARRLREAGLRNRGWRLEDHHEFDGRIRAAAPEKKRPAGRAAMLRQAIVWREVLGKPVSLRE